mmetsp:Transcript_3258/g.7864  ORF Transcript_3258/g.7864 Transcript_3258/m.7864 type:complete len:245 (+) Transcript_3258:159-893(+)
MTANVQDDVRNRRRLRGIACTAPNQSIRPHPIRSDSIGIDSKRPDRIKSIPIKSNSVRNAIYSRRSFRRRRPEPSVGRWTFDETYVSAAGVGRGTPEPRVFEPETYGLGPNTKSCNVRDTGGGVGMSTVVSSTMSAVSSTMGTEVIPGSTTVGGRTTTEDGDGMGGIDGGVKTGGSVGTGALVGTTGAIVGDKVGTVGTLVVGVAVGLCVGALVGGFVGFLVGGKVGCSVGLKDGFFVGVFVGT